LVERRILITPKHIAASASPIMDNPVRVIKGISFTGMPMSITLAIRSGMLNSAITSRKTRNGMISNVLRYLPRNCDNLRIKVNLQPAVKGRSIYAILFVFTGNQNPAFAGFHGLYSRGRPEQPFPPPKGRDTGKDYSGGILLEFAG